MAAIPGALRFPRQPRAVICRVLERFQSVQNQQNPSCSQQCRQPPAPVHGRTDFGLGITETLQGYPEKEIRRNLLPFTRTLAVKRPCPYLFRPMIRFILQPQHPSPDQRAFYPLRPRRFRLTTQCSRSNQQRSSISTSLFRPKKCFPAEGKRLMSIRGLTRFTSSPLKSPPTS